MSQAWSLSSLLLEPAEALQRSLGAWCVLWASAECRVRTCGDSVGAGMRTCCGVACASKGGRGGGAGKGLVCAVNRRRSAGLRAASRQPAAGRSDHAGDVANQQRITHYVSFPSCW